MYFCFMDKIKIYQTAFIEHLNTYNQSKAPNNLYDPVNYILNLGGKRLRPVLTLMACDAFGGDTGTVDSFEINTWQKKDCILYC